MIDIETLDNVPSAVILSIAAVEFDPDTGETGDSFHQKIDVDDQFRSSRSISQSTLFWWLEQSDKAQKSITKGVRYSLYDCLDNFSGWLKGKENCFIWANSPSFDIIILEHAWEESFIGKLFPKHWLQRDVRTIKQYINFEDFYWPGGTEHDALSDCYDQIAMVHAFYKQYGIDKED